MAKVHDIRVVSLRPNHYHGWPTLTRRRNGQLLLICTGGREGHVCPFGQVELMRSDDNGKTWRKLGNIAENPKAEYTNLDCFFTKNGDAVLTYLYANPAWNRKAIDLKAAIIPKAWFD